MKNLFLRTALVLGAMAAAGCGNTNMKQIKHLPYPETERGSVTDNYFGVEVADPYRWLEDDRSEATAAWVEAENTVPEDYHAQIPFRGAIRDRLTELWNYPKEGAPSKHGDWWYYYYNDGLQNQSALYRTKRPGEAGELILEPNTLSDDGTVMMLIIKGDTVTEETVSGRRETVRLSSESYNGERFPKDCLRIVNGVKGVYVDNGYNVKFKTVDFIYEGDAY